MSLVFPKVIPRPVTTKGQKCPNSDLRRTPCQTEGSKVQWKTKKQFSAISLRTSYGFEHPVLSCIFMHWLFLCVIKPPWEASVLFLPFLLFFF